MDAERFWSIVDAARVSAGSDLDARVEALRDGLSDASCAELQAFQNIYDEQIRRSYRWDLWGVAYLMNGGCSDDGFRYFRDWLISEGRDTFEKALVAPESLADLHRVEFAELESFGYVAHDLYDQKSEDELERDFSTEMAMPIGQRWEEEDLPRLFPRIYAVYGA